MHAVHVSPQGTFKKSGTYSSSPKDVDDLFDEITRTGAKKIVLHFHGGLVPESKGMEIADSMATVYRAAGAVPLSFVWETGFLDALRAGLEKNWKQDLFSMATKWLMKRLVSRIGGLDAKGTGVTVTMESIEQQLAQERPFATYDAASVAGGARGSSSLADTSLEHLEADLEAEFEFDLDGTEFVQTNASANARGTVGLKTAAFLAKIAYRVIKRFVQRRDHGLYPTVIEELIREIDVVDLRGKIWGPMKQKAADMFKSNVGISGTDLHVGSYVLEKIAQRQAVDPEFRASLVGHSAGSIAICHLLAANAKLSTPVRIHYVIWLAPAALSSLAVDEVASKPGRFAQFRMFTMSDSFESDDVLVPFLYTRSLLYLISGVLEDEVDAPLSGLMRHATGKAPFDADPAAAWAKFIGQTGRLVLADSRKLNPNADIGYRSGADKHGAFDNDPLTRESLTHLV